MRSCGAGSTRHTKHTDPYTAPISCVFGRPRRLHSLSVLNFDRLTGSNDVIESSAWAMHLGGSGPPQLHSNGRRVMMMRPILALPQQQKIPSSNRPNDTPRFHPKSTTDPPHNPSTAPSHGQPRRVRRRLPRPHRRSAHAVDRVHDARGPAVLLQSHVSGDAVGPPRRDAGAAAHPDAARGRQVPRVAPHGRVPCGVDPRGGQPLARLLDAFGPLGPLGGAAPAADAAGAAGADPLPRALGRHARLPRIGGVAPHDDAAGAAADAQRLPAHAGHGRVPAPGLRQGALAPAPRYVRPPVLNRLDLLDPGQLYTYIQELTSTHTHPSQRRTTSSSRCRCRCSSRARLRRRRR